MSQKNYTMNYLINKKELKISCQIQKSPNRNLREKLIRMKN